RTHRVHHRVHRRAGSRRGVRGGGHSGVLIPTARRAHHPLTASKRQNTPPSVVPAPMNHNAAPPDSDLAAATNAMTPPATSAAPRKARTARPRRSMLHDSPSADLR